MIDNLFCESMLLISFNLGMIQYDDDVGKG